MKKIFGKISLKDILKILNYSIIYNSIDTEDAMFLFSIGKVYKGKKEQ